jgi:hypothetical protein
MILQEQDHQVARIQAVFGLPEDAPLPRVDRGTLLTYRQHLESHLRVPFDALHAETRPPVRHLVHSVRVLRVLDVEHHVGDGLLCEVQNHRGTKALPLAEVGVREENPNYQIVDDYAYWFINCR